MTKISRPGFQSSETSSVEVNIYQHGDDPVVLFSEGGLYRLVGRKRDDSDHCVIGVQTNKGLGAASGQFSVTLKPSRAAEAVFQWLVDDDWIDLVFYRHDQPWHVMRGLVDEVRRVKAIGGNGATTEMYMITGRDFAKIWEMTPVWFSPYAEDAIVTTAISKTVIQGLAKIPRNPADTAEAFLKDFLEELYDNAGVNWNPPFGMPGITDNSFTQSFQVNKDGFGNTPERNVWNLNMMNPSGTLWQLAQQYSDNIYTELYADLMPNHDPLSPRLESGEPLDIGEMLMTVVVRDKPFPTSTGSILSSPWTFMPMSMVPRQQIISSDLGKSGMERFNTYYAASLLTQEQRRSDGIRAMAPLTDVNDMQRHGMRRMDVQSNTAPVDADFGNMNFQQRSIVRDWYVLNPYMLSGTLTLGVGRPDIRIGTRIKIPGELEDQSDVETYYVEQVSHSWTYGKGTQTTLGVTRGWIGDDDNSYQEKLDAQAAKYIEPVKRKEQ